MSDITWQSITVTLAVLQPWSRNPRRMSKKQAARLLKSFDDLGQFQTIAIGPRGEVYDGHQRLAALLKVHGPGYEVRALQSSRPLTEAEREQLTILSQTASGSWDWDALAGWDAGVLQGLGFDADLLAGWNDDAAQLRTLLEAEKEEGDAIMDAAGELPGLQALKQYPRLRGDNQWDIPDLLPEMLVGVPEPLDTWAGRDVSVDDGEKWWLYNWHTDSTRGLPLNRTLLAFYTDDRRFDMLWEQPDVYTSKLLNAGIRVSIAPNFSLWLGDARAMHLYNVFRSRWLARYLQEAGIGIIPDVNWANEDSFDFCLLGIPPDLPAIAVQLQTIKTNEEIERAIAGLRLAMERLRPKSLLVYGHSAAAAVVSSVGVSVPVIYAPNRASRRRVVLNKKKEGGL